MPTNATALPPAAHGLERCTACGHVVQRNDFCGCRTTLLAEQMAPRVPVAAAERVADQPARVNALNLGLAAAETETIEEWCHVHEGETWACSPRRCEGPDEQFVSPFDAAIEDLPADLRRVAVEARQSARAERERREAVEARDDERRSRGEG